MRKISYWILPLISAIAWLITLLSLLIRWTTSGSPHYPSMSDQQYIAYISDVGAQSLKPLFIVGCCITTLALDGAFLAERYLRHKGRLARNVELSEKVFAGLSIMFAGIGTVGLILLSVFDTLGYPKIHRLFLLLYIMGYIVSAIFVCWEYQRLGMNFRQHRVLRVSFWIKLAFILVEVTLAVAFGVELYRKSPNTAAVLEWVISFIFTLYVVSFLIDLFPAVLTDTHIQKANIDIGTEELNVGRVEPDISGYQANENSS